MMGIRLKVKEVCNAHGVNSASQLARVSGLAFAKANELYKGQVSSTDNEKDGRSVGILTLNRVAQALGVRTADLFEDE